VKPESQSFTKSNDRNHPNDEYNCVEIWELKNATAFQTSEMSDDHNHTIFSMNWRLVIPNPRILTTKQLLVVDCQPDPTQKARKLSLSQIPEIFSQNKEIEHSDELI
jgi:hypothetical protein